MQNNQSRFEKPMDLSLGMDSCINVSQVPLVISHAKTEGIEPDLRAVMGRHWSPCGQWSHGIHR
jgi:hypothetical protein